MMGMFDYVKVAATLPDGWDANELQSKDFDCAMTTIEITSDGRLRIEDFEYEDVPREERPYPDAESGTWQAICGCIRKTNRRWRDLNYHGIFNFYGGAQNDWHEYNAKFTDGRLVEITTA